MLFDNEPPGLEGINAAFEAEIAPHLNDLESRRKRVERRGYILFPVYSLIVLAVDFLVYQFLIDGSGDWTIALVLFTLTGFYIAYAMAFWKRSIIKEEHKNLIVRVCADFMSLTYLPEGNEDLADAFENCGLLPSHDKRTTQDGLEGRSDGVFFEMVELELEDEVSAGKNHRYETVFKGFLLSLDFPKSFEGVTLIQKEQGAFGGYLTVRGHSTEPVKLEDPVFENHFRVQSTDQVEARYLLTPTMMDRLLSVSEIYDKAWFAFDRGRIRVVCRQDDFLQAGSESSDLTDLDLVRHTLQELAIAKQFTTMLALERQTKI